MFIAVNASLTDNLSLLSISICDLYVYGTSYYTTVVYFKYL